MHGLLYRPLSYFTPPNPPPCRWPFSGSNIPSGRAQCQGALQSRNGSWKTGYGLVIYERDHNTNCSLPLHETPFRCRSPPATEVPPVLQGHHTRSLHPLLKSGRYFACCSSFLQKRIHRNTMHGSLGQWQQQGWLDSRPWLARQADNTP